MVLGPWGTCPSTPTWLDALPPRPAASRAATLAWSLGSGTILAPRPPTRAAALGTATGRRGPPPRRHRASRTAWPHGAALAAIAGSASSPGLASGDRGGGAGAVAHGSCETWEPGPQRAAGGSDRASRMPPSWLWVLAAAGLATALPARRNTGASGKGAEELRCSHYSVGEHLMQDAVVC